VEDRRDLDPAPPARGPAAAAAAPPEAELGRLSPARDPAQRDTQDAPPGPAVAGHPGYDPALAPRHRPSPVGAENTVTLRGLRIFVEQVAKPVMSPDAEVVVGGWDVGSAVGWSGYGSGAAGRWCSDQDGAGVEEVDRGDCLGLRRQELSPAGGCALRCWVDSGFLEDLPGGRGRDRVPETCQFGADPPVAPGRVVAGHLQHKPADRRASTGPSGYPAPIGPVPLY